MVNKKSWEEFRETGLLWWINSLLHLFGWAIVYEFNDSDITEILSVYPARVKFRGFDENSNDKGYRSVSEYMLKNIEELLEECE